MKLLKLRHAKRFSLTFLLLLTMCMAVLVVIFPVYAQQPTIEVVPTPSVANPGEDFTVSVNITDVADPSVWSIGVELWFDAFILGTTTQSVVEGDFLKEGWPPPDAYPSGQEGTMFAVNVDVQGAQGKVIVSISRREMYGPPWPPWWGGALPREGATGNGTLFTVKFAVIAAGESTLELHSTNLNDPDGTDISHNTSDGDFHTTVPVAKFTYSPSYDPYERPENYGRPIIGEDVTFNASESYDPDGGSILSYTWDFNDTTSPVIENDPITHHIFSDSTTPLKPYNVTLTVIDEEGETNTYFPTQTKDYVHVYFHDITILEITAPDEILQHEVATIDVTVLNKGSHAEAFNVTAWQLKYPAFPDPPPAVAIGTETAGALGPGENEIYSFDWITYINQTTKNPNATILGSGWNDPLEASASDNVYTYSSSNESYQEYQGYAINTAGWTGISKVEVGIEAYTEGDDRLSIQAGLTGKTLGEEYFYDVTSTTDTDEIFWVDVTGPDPSYWDLSMIHGNKMKVKIMYIEVGGTATPIYVDSLPVRITPLNPTEIPPGTYDIWANASLVNPLTNEFRAGQEEDTTDNLLLGGSINITSGLWRDIAITNVEVSPTEVALGGRSTVNVEIENKGNVKQTFNVLVYANSTEVGNQTVYDLSAGTTKTLPFDLDEATNDTVEGTYNITAYIPLVAGENVTTPNVETLFVLMRLLPAPFFTFSPKEPIVGDEVTFDASASRAPGIPGGTIEDFIWEFGDGTSATGIDIVSHIYNNPGTYNVKLTVVDNEGLSNMRMGDDPVSVKPLPSNITISASPATFYIGLNTTISGFISPVRDNVTVTVNYKRIDMGNWTSLADVLTNETGEYSLVWVPQQSGTYELKAFWPGDANTTSAESSVLDVTVIIQDVAVVDVVLSKIKLTIGENLTIDVTVANRGTATETFDVTVYYNDTLLETKTLANLTPGSTGTLSFDWDTQGVDEGVYIIEAVAETLLGETYLTDNSRTSSVFIQELTAETRLNIFLYTTIGLAIGIAVMAAYLVRMMKSKAK